jgi:DNA-binding Xre family transcriptional regulator
MKSDLLKKEILKKYKSVRNFAEIIGIPSSTIQSAIDTDNFDKMSVGRMIKICDELGIRGSFSFVDTA